MRYESPCGSRQYARQRSTGPLPRGTSKRQSRPAVQTRGECLAIVGYRASFDTPSSRGAGARQRFMSQLESTHAHMPIAPICSIETAQARVSAGWLPEDPGSKLCRRIDPFAARPSR